MELDTAKGMRDIAPSQQLLREHITNVFQQTCRRYGFSPLNTPIIERYDVLSAKFAAGEQSDAMSETYTLSDNGGRSLGLRFDLTVPLSRFVGMNRTLKLPFKRYQVGKVFRDAPIKAGRYREFTQCDADIVGTDSLLADATCISLALDLFSSLGLDVNIRVNNRQFLLDLFSKVGLTQEDAFNAIMSLDKLDKIGEKGVLEEIGSKELNEQSVQQVIDVVQNAKGSISEKLEFFTSHVSSQEGIDQLKELFSLLDDSRIIFDPVLARGLGYYTGTIFEIEGADPAIGSIGAGGRYDKLINSYLESADISTDKKYPAVGISFGLDRIVDIIGDKQQVLQQDIQAFLIPLKTAGESFRIAQQLRQAGLGVDIDLKGRGVGKNIQYALSQNIPFVIIVGEDELAQHKISVKELATKNEQLLSLEQTITFLKKQCKMS